MSYAGITVRGMVPSRRARLPVPLRESLKLRARALLPPRPTAAACSLPHISLFRALSVRGKLVRLADEVCCSGVPHLPQRHPHST